ncbi:hypothetical protein K7472_30320 [Streptomyces sp. PTM05]|uniref:Uncharacterized protein n=1 Tax=Streptantibioticus parmotrematis TaxID=2873249 RepID=A0ABS7R4X2_9ACTN|nr:hypothetical protein [Streptantibioticus parmotrematis]MBY8889109.1 hypothetical protein [Streptantibioticus parmotrematis]
MTPTETPVARKRRRKTRTGNINPRPPITISTLKITQIDLCPGKEHLVCPDCKTWCPITNVQSTAKLVPHHDRRAGTANPRRCSAGSNRRVVIDIAPGRWRTELLESVPSTARRATKVLRKPKTPRPPAVSQIEAAVRTARTAEQALHVHRQRCAACSGEATSRSGERLRCPDGERLATLYLRLREQEADPRRQRARQLLAEIQDDPERERDEARQRTRQRRADWQKVLPKVMTADARRAERPDGGAPSESPAVPLSPLRPRR